MFSPSGPNIISTSIVRFCVFFFVCLFGSKSISFTPYPHHPIAIPVVRTVVSVRPWIRLDPDCDRAYKWATNRRCPIASKFYRQLHVAPDDFCHSEWPIERPLTKWSKYCKENGNNWMHLIYAETESGRGQFFSFIWLANSYATKLTDKSAIQSTSPSIWWTKTKWKCTFSHWQCSAVECTANRASVSNRTDHICGKYIWWHVEICRPLDRIDSLAAYPINSSHANRTRKTHRRRTDSSATFAAECSPGTVLRIPNSGWRTIYGAVDTNERKKKEKKQFKINC